MRNIEEFCTNAYFMKFVSKDSVEKVFIIYRGEHRNGWLDCSAF